MILFCSTCRKEYNDIRTSLRGSTADNSGTCQRCRAKRGDENPNSRAKRGYRRWQERMSANK